MDLKFEYVKSHQDNNVYYNALDLSAQLNVNDDWLAEDKRHWTDTSSINAPVLSNTITEVNIDEYRITWDVKDSIIKEF